MRSTCTKRADGRAKKEGARLAPRPPNSALSHGAGREAVAGLPRCDQLQPLVPPQVSHLRQVPFRTRVKLPHSPQLSPSYPFIRAALICSIRLSGGVRDVVAWSSAARLVATATLPPPAISSAGARACVCPAP